MVMEMVKKTLQARLMWEQHSAKGKMVSVKMLKYPKAIGVTRRLETTKTRSEKLRKNKRRLQMLLLGLRYIILKSTPSIVQFFS